MIYIQNNEFYILSKELGEGYDLSTTSCLEDFQAGKIILLNDEQVAFRVANPSATTLEVFKMALTPIPQITLEQIKAQKIAEIEAYDMSPIVNSFTVNETSMWIDRNTRVSLLTTIAAYKANNKTNITLWTTGSNPIAITLTVIQLESLLIELEIYAKASYDVTANHKANVQTLTTTEDVHNYDFTTGYPEKLNYMI